MADFSFLSDSDDEKAVEELLSQAMDQTALELVAKINCSGFTDTVLPSHLETRFQKLKSFPSAGLKPMCSSTHRHSASSSSFVFNNSNMNKFEPGLGFRDNNDEDNDQKGKHEFSSKLEENSSDISGLKGNSKSWATSRGFKSSRKDEISFHSKKVSDGENNLDKDFDSEFLSSLQNEIVSSSRKAPECPRKLKFPDGRKRLEVKSSPSATSSNSSDSTLNSLSPPPRSGCFWCSPKKAQRKMSAENSILKTSLDWNKNDDMLSDLSHLSAKIQQKLLKKAMKEEEKINREAEKFVKLAKQASVSIEISSSMEDELSDSDIFK